MGGGRGRCQGHLEVGELLRVEPLNAVSLEQFERLHREQDWFVGWQSDLQLAQQPVGPIGKRRLHRARDLGEQLVPRHTHSAQRR